MTESSADAVDDDDCAIDWETAPLAVAVTDESAVEALVAVAGIEIVPPPDMVVVLVAEIVPVTDTVGVDDDDALDEEVEVAVTLADPVTTGVALVEAVVEDVKLCDDVEVTEPEAGVGTYTVTVGVWHADTDGLKDVDEQAEIDTVMLGVYALLITVADDVGEAADTDGSEVVLTITLADPTTEDEACSVAVPFEDGEELEEGD